MCAQFALRAVALRLAYNAGVMDTAPNVSFRSLHLLGLLLSIGALLIAVFFMEQYLGLPPCPLCIIDRGIVLIAAVLFLLAALHNPAAFGQRVYAGLNVLVCSAGAAVAGRHVWLQSLPPEEVPGCTPDLDYMLDVFPLQKVFTTLMNSAGECAEVSWTFLGLSIPWQTLLLFVALIAVSLTVAVKTARVR